MVSPPESVACNKEKAPVGTFSDLNIVKYREMLLTPLTGY